MRRLLAGLALLAVMLPSPAPAQDADAPVDAKPYWLPNEPWVLEHWLPYDEERLHALLRTTRQDLWVHLRDDRRTLAGFAARRGWNARRLAAALVAPRVEGLSAGGRSRLRRRALRTLTQGHLAQHILFHSLHQRTIPGRARQLFGVSEREFARLRRLQLSPLQIAAMHGRPSGRVHRLAVGALKATARRGVRGGDVSARQAALVLGRQLRHLARWLRQTRSITRRGPELLLGARYADAPAISADGSLVALATYDRELDRRQRASAFRIGLAGPALSMLPAAAGQGELGAQSPALSGDGTTVAYEARGDASGPQHQYGAPRVLVQPVAGGPPDLLPDEATGDPLAASVGPSLSHAGERVAFELTRPETPDGLGETTQTLVCDLRSGARAVASRADGAQGAPAAEAVLGSAISGNGRVAAFATRAPNLGADTQGGRRSAVFLRDLEAGRTTWLADDGADQSDPSISHDGSVVAYVATANGRSRVVVRDAAGRLRIVGPAPAWGPALAADGRTVAFVAGRRPAVWVADVATGVASRLSPAGRWAVHPAISADGRMVAFAAGSSRAIYLADRDTSKIRRLATGPV